MAMAAVFGAATSCTDILDTAPNDKLSSSTMWTTESSVDQGVIGVYYSLKNPFRETRSSVWMPLSDITVLMPTV